MAKWGFETERKQKPSRRRVLQRRRPEPDYRKAKATPPAAYRSGAGPERRPSFRALEGKPPAASQKITFSFTKLLEISNIFCSFPVIGSITVKTGKLSVKGESSNERKADF